MKIFKSYLIELAKMLLLVGVFAVSEKLIGFNLTVFIAISLLIKNYC